MQLAVPSSAPAALALGNLSRSNSFRKKLEENLSALIASAMNDDDDDLITSNDLDDSCTKTDAEYIAYFSRISHLIADRRIAGKSEREKKKKKKKAAAVDVFQEAEEDSLRVPAVECDAHEESDEWHPLRQCPTVEWVPESPSVANESKLHNYAAVAGEDQTQHQTRRPAAISSAEKNQSPLHSTPSDNKARDRERRVSDSAAGRGDAKKVQHGNNLSVDDGPQLPMSKAPKLSSPAVVKDGSSRHLRESNTGAVINRSEHGDNQSRAPSQVNQAALAATIDAAHAQPQTRQETAQMLLLPAPSLPVMGEQIVSEHTPSVQSTGTVHRNQAADAVDAIVGTAFANLLQRSVCTLPAHHAVVKADLETASLLSKDNLSSSPPSIPCNPLNPRLVEDHEHIPIASTVEHDSVHDDMSDGDMFGTVSSSNILSNVTAAEDNNAINDVSIAGENVAEGGRLNLKIKKDFSDYRAYFNPDFNVDDSYDMNNIPPFGSCSDYYAVSDGHENPRDGDPVDNNHRRRNAAIDQAPRSNQESHPSNVITGCDAEHDDANKAKIAYVAPSSAAVVDPAYSSRITRSPNEYDDQDTPNQIDPHILRPSGRHLDRTSSQTVDDMLSHSVIQANIANEDSVNSFDLTTHSAADAADEPIRLNSNEMKGPGDEVEGSHDTNPSTGTAVSTAAMMSSASVTPHTAAGGLAENKQDDEDIGSDGDDHDQELSTAAVHAVISEASQMTVAHAAPASAPLSTHHVTSDRINHGTLLPLNTAGHSGVANNCGVLPMSTQSMLGPRNTATGKIITPQACSTHFSLTYLMNANCR